MGSSPNSKKARQLNFGECEQGASFWECAAQPFLVKVNLREIVSDQIVDVGCNAAGWANGAQGIGLVYARRERQPLSPSASELGDISMGCHYQIDIDLHQ